MEQEQLLERYLNNQCTQPELKQVVELLTNSQNSEILPELYAEASSKFQSDFSMRRLHKKALWEAIKAETVEFGQSSDGYKNYSARFMRIAASVILLIGIGYFLNRYLEVPDMNEAVSLMKTVESPYGKKSKLTLPDGSVVIINSGTTITYPTEFDKATRVISITGEAFFDIIKDESRPFTINTPDVVVQVLGTSFNLKAYQEESFELTLVTGKVRVASIEDGNEQMTILPNHQVSFNKISKGFKNREVDVKEFMAWKEGKLVLNGDLQTVAKSIERWYNKKIIFKTETIKGCQVEASYVNEYLDNVLKSLSYLMNFEYKIEGEAIILDGKGCK